jgi:hypothetical protein
MGRETNATCVCGHDKMRHYAISNGTNPRRGQCNVGLDYPPVPVCDCKAYLPVARVR